MSRLPVLLAILTLMTSLASGQIVINEVLASNQSGLEDPDFGERGDWVELINTGASPAAITGLALSDTFANTGQWPIPTWPALEPGERIVIWCDGENTAGTALHTNFQLSADGEAVVLTHIAGDFTVDAVSFGSQLADVALARIPDATGDFQATELPTPGAANALLNRGPAPIFSLASGRFTAAQTLSITASPGATVRYTLDGSEPTVASPVVSSSLPISTTGPVRARAFYTSMDPSPVTTTSYFINPPTTLPIMDLVLPPSDFDELQANYDERGIEWERVTHVSVIPPDGSAAHEVTAGLRIHGGTTRDAEKKSLRLYFRTEYGASDWTLPWMENTPDPEFEQLVLRAGGNDVILVESSSQLNEVTYLRDQLQRDWMADLGQRSSDGFYVALHVNGAYWGLYNPCERYENGLFDDTFGGGDWDVIKGTWDGTRPKPRFFDDVSDGDITAWNEFLTWIDTTDLSVPANYTALSDRLDVQNFIDYFVLNIFTLNHDWPQNNWVAARRRSDPDAVWRFFEWDTEWGLGLFIFPNPLADDRDSLAWAMAPYLYQRENLVPADQAPLARIFNGILSNPEGEALFIRTMEEALNFEFRPEVTLAQLNADAASIEIEIPFEINRWAADQPLSTAPQMIANWAPAVQRMRDFLNVRPNEVRGYVVDHLSPTGWESISFSGSGTGSGRVAINGRLVDLPWSGIFFQGSEVQLAAVADSDSRFTSWSGAVTGIDHNATVTAGSTGSRSVSLTFTEGAEPNTAGGVIINEYWLNDDGPAYATIGNRPIFGDWVELLVTDTEGVDLRGWRLTNNSTKTQLGTLDDGDGSLILPSIPELADVPPATFILLVTSTNATNETNFPTDDLDATDGQMILTRHNGLIDDDTDPGFSIRTSQDDPVVLLAPGPTAVFADDVGVDFIAENTRVTPDLFGIATDGVSFVNPFTGIGSDDGAIFTNNSSGGLNNDNGADSVKDNLPGIGGWIVDPPSDYTEEGATPVILTPGAANTGQSLGSIFPELEMMGVVWE